MEDIIWPFLPCLMISLGAGILLGIGAGGGSCEAERYPRKVRLPSRYRAGEKRILTEFV